MSSFTEDDVRRLARLARVELTHEEVSQFAFQLGEILEFVRQIQAVDTGRMEQPAASPATVLRDDAVRPSLSREHALAGAPGADRSTGLFKVPRVLSD